MNRRGLIVLALALTVTSVSSVLVSEDKSDDEKTVVKSFKQFAADLIAGFKAEKHEQVESWDHYPCASMVELSGDLNHEPGLKHAYFRKALYEPSVDYGIDVRKTDSLISPYLGIVEFQWTTYVSNCATTKEEAQAMPSPTKLDARLKFRYKYAFQDGTWVAQGREIDGARASDGKEEWTDCKDNRLDFGCHVPEKARPAANQ